jgi:hypothetical protein
LIFTYELLKISSKSSPVFDVSVIVNDAEKVLNNSTLKHVKVCAKFKTIADASQASVYYEVEIPSGYIYQRVVEMQDVVMKKLINKIYARNSNTRVIIHFSTFDKGKEHCMTIEALKTHEIFNPRDASVKVYNYNARDSSAIEFYNFEKSCEVLISEDYGEDRY